MADPAIELLLTAKRAELPGGLHVQRAIPQAKRRMVGPFVFLDQMGPAVLEAGREITVLPHPHIGLSTITFLFEGEGLHKDSLGNVQTILPGEVNWMTAGRGVVHSERLRAGPTGRVFGVQIWVALPTSLEETEPTFEHYGVDAVPTFASAGVALRLVAGSLLGLRSRVRTSSPLFYAEAELDAGATFALPPAYDERAAYVVEGAVGVGDAALGAGDMAFFRRGAEVIVRADTASRVLFLGGDPLDGARHILWNFVSSSKERLRSAADDWRAQRFPRVPGETAFIPLPEDGRDAVDYP